MVPDEAIVDVEPDSLAMNQQNEFDE